MHMQVESEVLKSTREASHMQFVELRVVHSDTVPTVSHSLSGYGTELNTVEDVVIRLVRTSDWLQITGPLCGFVCVYKSE